MVGDLAAEAAARHPQAECVGCDAVTQRVGVQLADDRLGIIDQFVQAPLAENGPYDLPALAHRAAIIRKIPLDLTRPHSASRRVPDTAVAEPR
ncbi:hypothetical protein GCM10009677_17390 [Sphaerisporangium rubeum]